MKYIITAVCALFIGVNGTIVVIELTSDDTMIVQNEVVENITITESDTIFESVDKVYDAVFTVENTGNGFSGIGTGFAYKITDEYAYILTNYHVIDNYKKLEVSNHIGDKTDATLMGSDELLDLAVLRVNASFVSKVVTFGNSSESKIGDTVFAVGTPVSLDYRGTVTKGIISGTDREISVNQDNGDEFIMEVLQTNTAINPGNSGGPLVNINGEVIGINTLKLADEEIEGMGFAIPIELAESVLERLENNEEIKRPLLGVSLIDANQDSLLQYYQIDLDKIYNNGVVVVDTETDSTASKYGLKKGDVIVKINEDNIEDVVHFKYNLYKYEVGETITLEIIREGNSEKIEILLENSL